MFIRSKNKRNLFNINEISKIGFHKCEYSEPLYKYQINIMKKKMKAFLLTITLILFGFLLSACGSNVMAEQNYPLKIWKQNRNGQMETWQIVDENTGVNYIVVAPCYSNSGSNYDGVAITPRLNASGSLYVSK